MDEKGIDGAAVNYGGSVNDAAGRPASQESGSAPSRESATVNEQLDRILPPSLPQQRSR